MGNKYYYISIIYNIYIIICECALALYGRSRINVTIHSIGSLASILYFNIVTIHRTTIVCNINIVYHKLVILSEVDQNFDGYLTYAPVDRSLYDLNACN